MSGKTFIDTDLRNEVVDFLRKVANESEPVGLLTIKQLANDLYWRVKPQRTRGHNKPVVKAELPVQDIQPSQ